MTQITIAALLAAAIAAIAFRAGALTAGGALAAFGVGAVVFAAAGWPGAAVLFAFFLPSVLISRVGSERKRALVDAGKHGPRDGWQVLANGGVAALCALLAARGGAPFATAFAGAFAAAAADTWGTEIGLLSRSAPVSILTFRRVPPGLSGGISLLGSLASLAGALSVAVIAALVHVGPVLAVVAGGIAGALTDSILGASLQALRWCPACACECETRRHECGTATVMRRGLGWVENDAVNAAATFGGALVAMLYAAA